MTDTLREASTNCLKGQHNLCGYSRCDCHCHCELTAETGRMVNDVELERICNRLLVDQDAVPTRIETDYLLSALAQRATAKVDVRAATHDVVKWYSEMLERVPVKEEFEGIEAVLAQHVGQPVDVRVAVETWAAELADPIPYGTDATGPIPKPVAVPSVDVEVLIRRLTTRVDQPATVRARQAAAEEIIQRLHSSSLDHSALEDVLAIITKHSASRGDGEQMRALVAKWHNEADAAEPEVNRTWDDDGALRIRVKRALADELATVLGTIPANDDNGLRAAIEKVKAMRDKWDIKAQTMNGLRGWTINTAKVNAATEIITALEEMERGGTRSV